MYRVIHVFKKTDRHVMEDMEEAITSYGGRIIDSDATAATWAISHELKEDIGRSRCCVIEFDLDPNYIPELRENLVQITRDDSLKITDTSKVEPLFDPIYSWPIDRDYIDMEKTIDFGNGLSAVMRTAKPSIMKKVCPRIVSPEAGLLFFSEEYDDDFDRPFDAFICCPEIDENGKTTMASELANDIGLTLLALGYKVYRPIGALKNCGEIYKNYTWAMNSSRTIIFVGSDPSHYAKGNVLADVERFVWLRNHGHSIKDFFTYVDMKVEDIPNDLSELEMFNGREEGFLEKIVKKVRVAQITNTRSAEELLQSAVPPYFKDGWFVNALKKVQQIDDEDFMEKHQEFVDAVDDLIKRAKREGDYFLLERGKNSFDKYVTVFCGTKEQRERVEREIGEMLVQQLAVTGEYVENKKRRQRYRELSVFLRKYNSIDHMRYEACKQIVEVKKNLKQCTGFLQGGKRKKLERDLQELEERRQRDEKKLEDMRKAYGDDFNHYDLSLELKLLEYDIDACDRALNGEMLETLILPIQDDDI